MHAKAKATLLRLLLFLGVGVAIGIAVGSLRFDGRELLQALQGFSGVTLLGSFTLILVQISFQITRLWALCPPRVGMSWSQAAHSFASGQFVSNFIQSQAGHAVKVALLRKPADHRGRPMLAAESTAIVVVDKVFDVLMLLGLTGLALLQLGLHAQAGRYLDLNWLWGLPILGIASLLIYLLQGRSRRIQQWLMEFKQGLRVVKSPLQLGQAAGVGLGDWLCEGWSLQMLCVAQGFALSPAQLMVSLFILNVGVSIPISVANIGTFEASLVFALTRFGVPLVQGVAIATLFHLFQLVGTALWMLATLGKGRQSRAGKNKSLFG
ncbi:MAG: lysylphosphatidylglycerol synthase transmembrane domain-containing protein [Thermosynechococcaceae cyanobacterium]